MGWIVNLCVGVLTCAMLSAVEPNDVESRGELRTIAKGAFSGIQEPVQLVITNQTQWQEVWERHTAHREPKKPAPEIDFSKETVLFYGMGRKNTGGYSVEITEVRRDADPCVAVVKSNKPKPGGFNLQALTAPFHAVAVARLESKVIFKTE